MACKYGARWHDIAHDMAEVEAQIASFKRICPGKSATEQLCEDLRAEAEEAAATWRESLAEVCAEPWWKAEEPRERSRSRDILPAHEQRTSDNGACLHSGEVAQSGGSHLETMA